MEGRDGREPHGPGGHLTSLQPPPPPLGASMAAGTGQQQLVHPEHFLILTTVCPIATYLLILNQFSRAQRVHSQLFA